MKHNGLKSSIIHTYSDGKEGSGIVADLIYSLTKKDDEREKIGVAPISTVEISLMPYDLNRFLME